MILAIITLVNLIPNANKTTFPTASKDTKYTLRGIVLKIWKIFLLRKGSNVRIARVNLRKRKRIGENDVNPIFIAIPPPEPRDTSSSSNKKLVILFKFL